MNASELFYSGERIEFVKSVMYCMYRSDYLKGRKRKERSKNARPGSENMLIPSVTLNQHTDNQTLTVEE